MEENRQAQLQDLYPWYPDQDDPRLATLIAGMREFEEVRGLPDESLPESGKFFNHQKLVHRLMYFCWVLDHFADTGTGKTCSASQAADQHLLDPRSGIKQVVIILSNQQLINEFAIDLVENCTNGRFKTKKYFEAKTERSRMTYIKKVLEQAGYIFWTAGRFGNKVREMSDLEVQREFSQTFFIVDEKHNIRPRKDPASQDSDEKVQEMANVYDSLLRVFSLALWFKYIGMTATPMRDSANEIVYPFNILLAAAGRDLYPDNEDFSDVTVEELEERLRGLISVVRSLDTGVDLQIMGTEISEEGVSVPGQKPVDVSTIIYEAIMSDLQSEVYADYSSGNQPRSTVHTRERQAASAVFPPKGGFEDPPDPDEAEVADEGFRTNVKILKEGDKGKKSTSPFGLQKYQPRSWYQDEIENMDSIQELSGKKAVIIDVEKKQSKKKEPGKAWIYCEFINPSAVDTILKLEAQGFEIYNGTVPSFDLEGGKPGKIKFPKKPRVALLHKSEAQSRNIRDLFNHPDNLDGEYLQIVIGTQSSRMGISLMEVLRIYALDTSWNTESDTQFKARALRSVGHRWLLNRLRKRTGNPNARITVQFYPLAAIVNPEVSSERDLTEKEESIDRWMYLRAAAKDQPIRAMKLKYAAIAVDCLLNRLRNVVGIDPSGQTLEYDCFYPPPTEEEKSDHNFIALYADEEINRIIAKMSEVFKTRFGLTQEEVYQYFRDESGEMTTLPLLIDMAIQKLVVNKISILDRFGLESFVQQSKGFIFLQRSFATEPADPGLSFYESRIFGQKKLSLADITSALQNAENIETEIDILRAIDTRNDEGFDQFQNMILDLNLEDRVQLLETSLLHMVHAKDTQFDEDVREALEGYWFKYRDITSILNDLSRAPTGRGKKPKEGTLTEAQEEILKKAKVPTKGSPVYIHTLKIFPRRNVRYSSIRNKFNLDGPIRILPGNRESSGKITFPSSWRLANPIENRVFRHLTKQFLMEQYIKFEQNRDFQIYGIRIDNQPEFWIRDRSKEGDEIPEDSREWNTGNVCNNLHENALISIMWRLGFDPPEESIILEQVQDPEDITLDIRREKLVQQGIDDVDEMNDEEVNFIWSWIIIEPDKKDICRMIKEYLEDNDQVLYI